MDDAYKATQSQIYSLQETLLDSNRNAKKPKKEKDVKDKDKDKEKEKKPRAKKRKTDDTAPQRRNNSSRRKKVDEVRVLVVSESLLSGIKEEDKRYLGAMEYDAVGEGKLNQVVPKYIHSNTLASVGGITVPFPFDLEHKVMPVPFLPEFAGDKVYSVVTVKIKFEDLMASFQRPTECPRTLNNEVWGCDIYTDDTDPILALRHCGFSLSQSPAPASSGTTKQKLGQKVIVPAPLQRTPANLKNKDNVVGEIPRENGEVKPFDLEVDLILLPRLHQYFSVKRFGITSRHWGAFSAPLKSDAYTVHIRMSMHMNLEDNIYPTETVPHDGISYGIHKVVIKPRESNFMKW